MLFSLFPSILAGASSYLLFLTTFHTALGTVFILLPILPLLYIGMKQGLPSLGYAILVASIPLLIGHSVAALYFYLIMIAFPALLIAPRARLMVSSTGKHNASFFPVGTLMTDCVIYAAIIFAAVAIRYYGEGGLSVLLEEHIAKTFSEEAMPNLQPNMQALITEWGFALIAASAWMWVALLYVHALIASIILQAQGKQPRPSLGITPFTLPKWLLLLQAALSMLSFMGDPEIAFMAKILFLILIMPYFLLGISIVHESIRQLPSRGLLLTLLYLTVVILFWPAFIVAGIGLWRQLKEMYIPKNSSAH